MFTVANSVLRTACREYVIDTSIFFAGYNVCHTPAACVAIPFGVRRCWRVTDPRKAERLVHACLIDFRLRIRGRDGLKQLLPDVVTGQKAFSAILVLDDRHHTPRGDPDNPALQTLAWLRADVDRRDVLR
ncbi:MAG: hypothetical protein EOS23_29640 [Mesorhizobium sp.]|uniref:GIY-YIG nuclease family protein n=1 Tax=Mesorhizobium sp. TaxID=1871066 RepID=UPI000FE9693C|nr:GIY-YIG nuclease family protein [Mesorhizobium sp.]RWE06897.1 MAG: hypothetical protein EOS23_29640 [Mesorhizobium sp.]RWE81288.1 MAG: hypothetical protein EOS49_30225 [Mesorhizobium sp.]